MAHNMDFFKILSDNCTIQSDIKCCLIRKKMKRRG